LLQILNWFKIQEHFYQQHLLIQEQHLAALGSIGADMTEGEREEATDMVVATVVAAGAAINAAAVAAGGSTSGGTGGGGSSGGGSGANSPGSRGGRKW
jgi:hypothetical protein